MAKLSFKAEAWKKLRPEALDFVVETGLYFRIWVTVLVAHVVRIGMSYWGIDEDLVALVAGIEKWVFLASFAAFFWRILERVLNTLVTKHENS